MSKNNENKHLVYMDNNATTRVSPDVLKEMEALLQDDYGNPSSIHSLGKQAKQLMEIARHRVATFLNCDANNIIFTSGGTESNNLAISGVAQKLSSNKHFITSNVEHPSVLQLFASLESQGHRVTYLTVNRNGGIDPDQLEQAICEDTVLISIMMANNETGVIFPIKKLAQIASINGIPFHCDAVQGAGKLPIDISELGVDMLSISAHKFHGPKGTGALFVGNMDMISPLILGGGHEQGKRSGTEALPAIVGMGKACEISAQTMSETIPKIEAMRGQLEQGIQELFPNCRINGEKESRLCNTSNILFPGTQGHFIVEELSKVGICVSSGSACSSCHNGGSHVLKAMNLSLDDCNSSLRISLSKENQSRDIERFLDILPKILESSGQTINREDTHNHECPSCRVVAASMTEKQESVNPSYSHLLPGLDQLIRETTGDPEICVAILDGATDVNHPCFNGANLTKVESLLPLENTDDTFSRHGTHIASIIFGQPGTAITGIAPQCKGLSLQIFRESKGKILPSSQMDLARAINRAVESGAQVINISGGQFEESGEASVFLSRSIEMCVKNGVLIVAAAGNNGCDCHHVPASLPDVLVVGAMNQQGEPMEFSNWGEKYQDHGLLAPGEDIIGAVPGGGSATGSGTSYAAPIVTGIIALLLSLQKQRGEKVDAYKIKDALLQSAIPCEIQNDKECSRFLTGRLDVGRAMNLLFPKGKEAKDNDNQPEGYFMNITTSGLKKNSQLNHNFKYLGGNKMEELHSDETIQSIEMSDSDKDLQSIAAEENTPADELNQSTVLPSEANESCPSCNGVGRLYPSVGQFIPEQGNALQKVYVLGTLGYDFGFEARKDNIFQNMEPGSNPHNVNHMLEHLDKNPWDAGALLWTLNLNTTPIYAILPVGPFAQDGYKLLRDFLKAQVTEGTERVAIPGIISGHARLLSGLSVPVIRPDIRGMYNWRTKDLVEAVCGKAPEKEKDEKYNQKFEGVKNLLDRIYYDIQNLGMAASDRALNFAATNAFNVEKIIENATKKKFQLLGIDSERSAICRPESDCWDVKLTFFDPENRNKRAKQVYRYTVDVSDAMPVTIGNIRSWNEY